MLFEIMKKNIKKSIIIAIICFLVLSILTCGNTNRELNPDELLRNANKLEDKLKRDPNNLNLIVSTARAYERLGNYYYEQEAYNYIGTGTKLDDIETYSSISLLGSLENVINTAIKFYQKAIDIYEEGKFQYNFVNRGGRRVIEIRHTDEKVSNIYNRIQRQVMEKGFADESQFTQDELKLKWEWDQRLNKIIHFKLGRAYRALVPIYLAYANDAIINEKYEKAKNFEADAAQLCIKAEKEYKISLAVDSKYKEPYLALAKLYLYMYEKFQKNSGENASLNLSLITVEKFLVEIERDNLDALFVKAKIYYYYSSYEKALDIYERQILRHRNVTPDSNEYKKAMENIQILKRAIASTSK